jgi:hypothetical protein
MLKDGEKVFVCGRQVNDLRAVDYDAIGMLNISFVYSSAKPKHTFFLNATRYAPPQ